MIRFATAALVSTFVALPALASTTFTATLQTPTTEKQRLTAYDAVWICEGETCEAILNRKSATVRVCKKVVEEIGAVKTFGTEADPLTEEELEKCNASLN